MVAGIALILAPRDDAHAHAVVHEAKLMGRVIEILDVQEFTRLYNLRTRLGSCVASLSLSRTDAPGSIEASTILGIWYRRPFGYAYVVNQATDNGGVSALAEFERRAALIGSLDGFVENCFNDIGRSRKANYKPAQLLRARKVGLTVPETLITNDPAAVKEFVESIYGRVVYKTFGSPSLGVYGTRVLGKEDMMRLDRLTICPAIFQEFIDSDFDVRATVVGNKVFSARIVFDRNSEHIDTRFLETEVTQHRLPAEIEQKLVQLVESFGLVYSSIDLRYSEKLGYVFLESNPEGQYLWTEIEADLKISREIASQLLSPQGPLST